MGHGTRRPKIVLFLRTILRLGAAVSSRESREIGGPLPSPRRSGGMAKRKSRAAGSTLPRRSEKPGGLVDFRTAKWKTGWPGGLFQGEAENFSTAKWERRAGRWTFARRSEKPGGQVDFSKAKRRSSASQADFRTAKRRSFGGRGLSHGEAANWGAQSLRVYKRKEKPQAAKGDGTANFVTKGRRGRRRFVAGSSPKRIRNDAGKTWLFGRKGAKMAVPKGKKAKSPQPPRPTPKSPPRGYPQRLLDPTCATSAKRATRHPAPVRPLERSLWVPPTTEPFRLAPSGKPRKGKGRKEEPPMPRPPPLCPRWVSHPNSA